MKLILSADWHIRHSTPRAREQEEFIRSQFKKIREIFRIRKEEGGKIIIAGDMFHQHNISPEIMIRLIDLMKRYGISEDNLFVLPGNGRHDLYMGQIDSVESNTNLGVLKSAGLITILTEPITFREDKIRLIPYNYYEDLKEEKRYFKGYVNIVVIHKAVSNNPKEQSIGYLSPSRLLKQLHMANVVVSGHNHIQFSYTLVGKDDDDPERYLINPGPITRQSITEIAEINPAVYIYDSYRNDFERKVLTFHEKVEIIERTKESDKKMSRKLNIGFLVDKLKIKSSKENMFEKLIDSYFEHSKKDKEVYKIIMEHLPKKE